MRASFAGSTSASRRSSGCATTIASSRPTRAKPPNHTIGSKPPTEGRPTSRMTCACHSRSYDSLHIPPNAAMPRMAIRAGRARISLTPVRPVCAICENDPRSPRSRRRNPRSGMQKAKKTASRIVPHAAEHDRQPEVDDPEPDRGQDPADGSDSADLGAAQIHRRHPLRADLVGEPGIHRAARERVAEAPDRIAGEHDPHSLDADDDDEAQPHDDVPDHDREPPRVRVARRSRSAPRRGRPSAPSPSRRRRARAGSSRARSRSRSR